MKSLLVDAIRRANDDETDKALSDSGTLESTGGEFGATANDSVADAGDATNVDELQLFETSKGLSIGEANLEYGTGPIEDHEALAVQQAARSTATVLRHVDAYAVPVVSKYSPHLCIVLALLAAAGWMLFQEFQFTANDGGLGALRASSAMQESARAVNRRDVLFRFIHEGQRTIPERAE